MTDELKKTRRNLLSSSEIAGRVSDPNFFQSMDVLANPDPILRKLGKDQEVYDAILYDAHVMGETRSLRAGLLGYEWRIKPGGDDPASIQAFDVINERMKQRPTPSTRWDDLHWNIYDAVFKGQSVHEIGWEYDGKHLFPTGVRDRPARRVKYGVQNEIRIITKDQPLNGIELPDERRMLICRHMPSFSNPYGVAVLSSCFWPYTFKHAGWKWFAKFAEKFGMPWPVGKYPQGTPVAEQEKFVRLLAEMVDLGVFAIPDDSGLEFHKGSSTGEPIQERLINMSNAEMSKALTSQTLSSEIKGNGSYAAAETHRNRELSISKTDRDMVSETINTLLKWTTDVNFIGASAPTHEFYKEEDPREKWVDVLDKARKFLPISQSFAYDRLDITAPEAGDDLLSAEGGSSQSDDVSGSDTGSFSKDSGKTADAVMKVMAELLVTGEAADFMEATKPEPSDGLAVDNIIKPIRELLDSADSMEDFQDKLASTFPEMDDSTMTEYLTMALSQHSLEGRADEA